MSKFRQADEGFEWVFKAEGVDAQITRLKEWAKTNQALIPIVRMGVGAEKPDWDLPEGTPEINDIKEDIPGGMGETTLQIEWRRVKQFITPESNMSNLPRVKREQQWLNILEGVHHKEAKILTAVKDGKLLELYPQLETLLKPLGITEYNKTETKPKRKARDKKNVEKSS
jgi:hypothetical protein